MGTWLGLSLADDMNTGRANSSDEDYPVADATPLYSTAWCGKVYGYHTRVVRDMQREGSIGVVIGREERHCFIIGESENDWVPTQVNIQAWKARAERLIYEGR